MPCCFCAENPTPQRAGTSICGWFGMIFDEEAELGHRNEPGTMVLKFILNSAGWKFPAAFRGKSTVSKHCGTD